MGLNKNLTKNFNPDEGKKNVPNKNKETNYPPKIQSSKNYILLSSMRASKIKSNAPSLLHGTP